MEGQVGTIPFKASGRQILELGWRIIYVKDKKEEKDEKDKDEEQSIQNLLLAKKATTNL